MAITYSSMTGDVLILLMNILTLVMNTNVLEQCSIPQDLILNSWAHGNVIHRIRGSGVLRKGQHSWNISVMKEARMVPKVVLESSMEFLFHGIFFCP